MNWPYWVGHYKRVLKNPFNNIVGNDTRNNSKPEPGAFLKIKPTQEWRPGPSIPQSWLPNQMTPETLKITGTNELVGGFAIGPNIVHRLAVYLLFLDNQGIVIENVLVYAGDYVGVIPLPMEFERTIPMPEGARMISFAYDGVVPGEYTIGFSPSRQ